MILAGQTDDAITIRPDKKTNFIIDVIAYYRRRWSGVKPTA